MWIIDFSLEILYCFDTTEVQQVLKLLFFWNHEEVFRSLQSQTYH